MLMHEIGKNQYIFELLFFFVAYQLNKCFSFKDFKCIFFLIISWWQYYFSGSKSIFKNGFHKIYFKLLRLNSLEKAMKVKACIDRYKATKIVCLKFENAVKELCINVTKSLQHDGVTPAWIFQTMIILKIKGCNDIEIVVSLEFDLEWF